MEAGRDLTLAEALDSLRDQLLDAVDQAQGEDLQLECQGVEVELQVVVSDTVRAEGKLGFWSVLTIGGSVDHGSAYTHKIRVSLLPKLKGSTGKLPMTDTD